MSSNLKASNFASRRHAKTTIKPGLENLESRLVPAKVVTTILDTTNASSPTPGSLRAAVTSNVPSDLTVEFNDYLFADSIGVTHNPTAIALGDFTGGGRVDVVSASRFTNTLSISGGNTLGFLKQSDTNYGTYPQTASASTTTWALESADLDGNGKADIISAQSDGMVRVYLKNSGSLSVSDFSLAASPITPITLTAPNSSTTSVVFPSLSPSWDQLSGPLTGTILRNGTPIQTFSFAQNTSTCTPVDSGPQAIKATSANYDTTTDVLSLTLNAVSPTDTFTIRFNSYTAASRLGIGATVTGFVTGDFNDDGKIDFAAGLAGSPSQVAFALGNGNGTFGKTNIVSLTGTGSANLISLSVGDVNGDGTDDVVALSSTSSTGVLTTLLGSTSTPLTAASQFSTAIPGGPFNFLALGEFSPDTDGFVRADAIVVNSTQGILSIFKASTTTAGAFITTGTGVSNTNLTANALPGIVRVADLNADGKADIAVTQPGLDNVAVYTGKGDGTLNSGPSTFDVVDPTDIRVRDMNSDGFLDIVASSETSQSFAVFTNSGNASFGPAASKQATFILNGAVGGLSNTLASNLTITGGSLFGPGHFDNSGNSLANLPRVVIQADVGFNLGDYDLTDTTRFAAASTSRGKGFKIGDVLQQGITNSQGGARFSVTGIDAAGGITTIRVLQTGSQTTFDPFNAANTRIDPRLSLANTTLGQTNTDPYFKLTASSGTGTGLKFPTANLRRTERASGLFSQNTTGFQMTLDGLSIRAAHDNTIILTGGSLAVSNCTFDDIDTQFGTNRDNRNFIQLQAGAGNLSVTNTRFENSRVDAIRGGSSGTIIIAGSSFSNNDGQALRISAGTVNITGSTFTNNGDLDSSISQEVYGSASVPLGSGGFNGGRSMNAAGTVTATNITVSNSLFDNNRHATIPSVDRALYLGGGTIDVSNSIFRNHTNNGALELTGSKATVTTSQFDGNAAPLVFNADAALLGDRLRGGAAILIRDNTALSLTLSKFTNNVVDNIDSRFSGGGAIHTYNGSIDISECAFEGNSAVITDYPNGGSPISFNDPQTSPTARFSGGGALFAGAKAVIRDSYFTNNFVLSHVDVWNPSYDDKTKSTQTQFSGGGAVLLTRNLDQSITSDVFNTTFVGNFVRQVEANKDINGAGKQRLDSPGLGVIPIAADTVGAGTQIVGISAFQNRGEISDGKETVIYSDAVDEFTYKNLTVPAPLPAGTTFYSVITSSTPIGGNAGLGNTGSSASAQKFEAKIGDVNCDSKTIEFTLAQPWDPSQGVLTGTIDSSVTGLTSSFTIQSTGTGLVVTSTPPISSQRIVAATYSGNRLVLTLNNPATSAAETFILNASYPRPDTFSVNYASPPTRANFNIVKFQLSDDWATSSGALTAGFTVNGSAVQTFTYDFAANRLIQTKIGTPPLFIQSAISYSASTKTVTFQLNSTANGSDLFRLTNASYPLATAAKVTNQFLGNISPGRDQSYQLTGNDVNRSTSPVSAVGPQLLFPSLPKPWFNQGTTLTGDLFSTSYVADGSSGPVSIPTDQKAVPFTLATGWTSGTAPITGSLFYNDGTTITLVQTFSYDGTTFTGTDVGTPTIKAVSAAYSPGTNVLTLTMNNSPGAATDQFTISGLDYPTGDITQVQTFTLTSDLAGSTSFNSVTTYGSPPFIATNADYSPSTSSLSVRLNNSATIPNTTRYFVSATYSEGIISRIIHPTVTGSIIANGNAVQTFTVDSNGRLDITSPTGPTDFFAISGFMNLQTGKVSLVWNSQSTPNNPSGTQFGIRLDNYQTVGIIDVGASYLDAVNAGTPTIFDYDNDTDSDFAYLDADGTLRIRQNTRIVNGAAGTFGYVSAPGGSINFTGAPISLAAGKMGAGGGVAVLRRTSSDNSQFNITTYRFDTAATPVPTWSSNKIAETLLPNLGTAWTKLIAADVDGNGLTDIIAFNKDSGVARTLFTTGPDANGNYFYYQNQTSVDLKTAATDALDGIFGSDRNPYEAYSSQIQISDIAAGQLNGAGGLDLVASVKLVSDDPRFPTDAVYTASGNLYFVSPNRLDALNEAMNIRSNQPYDTRLDEQSTNSGIDASTKAYISDPSRLDTSDNLQSMVFAPRADLVDKPLSGLIYADNTPIQRFFYDDDAMDFKFERIGLPDEFVQTATLDGAGQLTLNWNRDYGATHVSIRDAAFTNTVTEMTTGAKAVLGTAANSLRVPAHGLPTGTVVTVSGSSAPTGLFNGSRYFVSNSIPVVNKALSNGIATLTTSEPHGLQAGDTVTINIGDPVFDGTFTIRANPLTSTTFSYDKTSANVASSPVITGMVSSTNVLRLAASAADASLGKSVAITGAFTTSFNIVPEDKSVTFAAVGSAFRSDTAAVYVPGSLTGFIYVNGVNVQSYTVGAGGSLSFKQITNSLYLAVPTGSSYNLLSGILTLSFNRDISLQSVRASITNELTSTVKDTAENTFAALSSVTLYESAQTIVGQGSVKGTIYSGNTAVQTFTTGNQTTETTNTRQVNNAITFSTFNPVAHPVSTRGNNFLSVPLPSFTLTGTQFASGMIQVNGQAVQSFTLDRNQTPKQITNKELTNNVATITTQGAHNLAVGDTVIVSIGDAIFDGTVTITAVTATTFNYAKINANISSAGTMGSATPLDSYTFVPTGTTTFASGGSFNINSRALTLNWVSSAFGSANSDVNVEFTYSTPDMIFNFTKVGNPEVYVTQATLDPINHSFSLVWNGNPEFSRIDYSFNPAETFQFNPLPATANPTAGEYSISPGYVGGSSQPGLNTTFRVMKDAVLAGSLNGTIYLGDNPIQTFRFDENGAISTADIGYPTLKVTGGRIDNATGTFSLFWNSDVSGNSPNAIVSYRQAYGVGPIATAGQNFITANLNNSASTYYGSGAGFGSLTAGSLPNLPSTGRGLNGGAILVSEGRQIVSRDTASEPERLGGLSVRVYNSTIAFNTLSNAFAMNSTGFPDSTAVFDPTRGSRQDAAPGAHVTAATTGRTLMGDSGGIFNDSGNNGGVLLLNSAVVQNTGLSYYAVSVADNLGFDGQARITQQDLSERPSAYFPGAFDSLGSTLYRPTASPDFNAGTPTSGDIIQSDQQSNFDGSELVDSQNFRAALLGPNFTNIGSSQLQYSENETQKIKYLPLARLSPARDAGTNILGTTDIPALLGGLDIRGAQRKINNTIDIGAFEVQVASITTLLNPTTPGANSQNPLVTQSYEYGQPIDLDFKSAWNDNAAPSTAISGTLTVVQGARVLGSADYGTPVSSDIKDGKSVRVTFNQGDVDASQLLDIGRMTSIYGIYSGSKDYASSESPKFDITITKASTSVALNPLSRILSNSPVTISGMVTTPSSLASLAGEGTLQIEYKAPGAGYTVIPTTPTLVRDPLNPKQYSFSIIASASNFTSLGTYDIRAKFIANSNGHFRNSDGDTYVSTPLDVVDQGRVSIQFMRVASSSTLTAQALSSDTQLQVSSTSGFSVGDILAIGQEKVLVTAINGALNTLTVTRAQFGTSSTTYPSGTTVDLPVVQADPATFPHFTKFYVRAVLADGVDLTKRTGTVQLLNSANNTVFTFLTSDPNCTVSTGNADVTLATELGIPQNAPVTFYDYKFANTTAGTSLALLADDQIRAVYNGYPGAVNPQADYYLGGTSTTKTLDLPGIKALFSITGPTSINYGVPLVISASLGNNNNPSANFNGGLIQLVQTLPAPNTVVATKAVPTTPAANAFSGSFISLLPSVGFQRYDATYSGDGFNYESLDTTNPLGILNVTVNKASTSANIPNSSTVRVGLGTVVPLTINLSNGEAGASASALKPTGTINFFSGANLLGTAVNTDPSSGSFTFNFNAPVAGTYQLSFSYSGDENYNPISPQFVRTVVVSSLGLSLGSSPANVRLGDSVNFSATYSPFGNATEQPSKVFFNFYKGSTLFLSTGVDRANDATGTYTLSGAVGPSGINLPSGTYTVTATYDQGTGVYPTLSSASRTLNVNLAQSSTTLTPPASIRFGQAVDISATVTGVAGLPFASGGVVSLLDGSVDLTSPGLAVTGTSPVTKTLNTSALSVGSHNLQARFSGDSNYLPSNSIVVPVTVNRADTTSAISVLTPATGVVAAGSPLTFRVNVVPAAYVASTAAKPTGTVIFVVGGITQAPVAVASDGTAPLTINPVISGSFTASASYSGDGNYLASTTSTSATYSVVSLAMAPLAVASQVRTSIQRGESLQLSATLAGATAPAGTVQFGITGTGAAFTVIATGTAGQNGLYSATIDTGAIASLPVGTFSIAARYIPATGDPVPASTSSSRQLIVSKQATLLSGGLGSLTIPYGSQIPIQNGLITPGLGTGSSIAFAAGSSVGLFAAGVQNTSLPFTDANRSLSVPASSAALTPGSYAIQLRYAGDTNYAASTLDLPAITVTKASTTVALTPSSGTVLRSGTPVTIAASVSTASAGLAPSGFVQFSLNGTVIRTVALASGKASFVHSPTISGPAVFSARYLGDSNYTDSTATATLRTAARQPFFAVATQAGSFFMTYDSKTRQQRSVFQPLGRSYTGGFRVATGDVNGDGVADLAWTSNTGSFVRLIDGLSGRSLGGFFAFGSTFARPVNIAIADYNGDGKGDIIAAPGGAGVAASVRVFSGANYSLLLSKAVLGGATGGVSVTGGDVDGDGRDEVMVAPMSGAGPRLQVYKGGTGALMSDITAFATASKSGYSIAAADFTGDGKVEVVMSPMSGAQQAVVIGNSRLIGTDTSGTLEGSFPPFSSTFSGGARVSIVDDINGDGIRDIVVTSGPGGQSQVRRFSGRDLTVIDSFFAYAANVAERNKGIFGG